MRHADPSAKCLLFSQQMDVLELTARYLPSLGIPAHSIARLDSQQDVRQRREDQSRFQEHGGDPWLCLCATMVSGVGVNLFAANHMFFMEPFESEADETQAISRLLRIGQRKQVHVTTLFARGTVEERILQLRRSHTPEQAFSFGGTVKSGGMDGLQDQFLFGIEDIRRIEDTE